MSNVVQFPQGPVLLVYDNGQCSERPLPGWVSVFHVREDDLVADIEAKVRRNFSGDAVIEEMMRRITGWIPGEQFKTGPDYRPLFIRK